MLNAADLKKDSDTVVIKKYPNRRLYNTDTSTYVTLDDLCELVKKGVEFNVFDAKSNEDITRQILTQIIFEQEQKGYNMLPVSFLRQVISMYDNKIAEVIPHYLESVMHNFMANQERMRDMVSSLGAPGYSPFSQLEEMSKQNMNFFNQAMSMFNPLGMFNPAKSEEKKTATGGKK